MKKSRIVPISFLLVSLCSCPSPVQTPTDPSSTPAQSADPTPSPSPSPTPDANPPSLSSLSAPATIRDDQGFDVSISAVDPEGSSLAISLYDGDALLCPLSIGNGDVYSARYEGFETEKTYSGLSIRAKDSAGNEASVPVPSLYVQSTNSRLSGIRTTVGSLSPAFSPTTTSYTISVPSGSRVSVTATRASSKATGTMTQSTSGRTTTATYTITAEAGIPYRTIYTVAIISR